MPRRPAIFQESDVTRACRGTLKAGLKVRRVEITSKGDIYITCDEIPSNDEAVKSLDDKIAQEIHAP